MGNLRRYILSHRKRTAWMAGVGVVITGVYLFRLGSLAGGVSLLETKEAAAPVGWHGVFDHPFYLPLQVVRSVVFVLAPAHGQTLSRLPTVLFGLLAIVSFALLVRLWHGSRVALLSTALFTTSAWTLHVSRLVDHEVLYLWIIPSLLLINVVLHRQVTRASVLYISIAFWGMALYIPGMIWFLLPLIYWQWDDLRTGWKALTQWWQRGLLILLSLVWLPLLIIALTRHGGLRLWLGLPSHFPTMAHLAKQFVAVPVHLFLRGPAYPDRWLARAPLLDIAVLLTSLIGIYFYVRHYRAFRSMLLGIFLLIGSVLVGLGGSVGLSVMVPIIYITSAAGIGFLLRDWLKVFPVNPLARGLGIGLVTVVVALSCVYNLRAYFVAWPHNTTTQALFQHHLSE